MDNKLKLFLDKLDVIQLEEINTIITEKLSDTYDDEYWPVDGINKFAKEVKKVMEFRNHYWAGIDNKDYIPSVDKIEDTIYWLYKSIKADKEVDMVWTWWIEIIREDELFILNYKFWIII